MTLLPPTIVRFAAGASFTFGLMGMVNAQDVLAQQPAAIVVQDLQGSALAVWTSVIGPEPSPRRGRPAILESHAGGQGSLDIGFVAWAIPAAHTAALGTAATPFIDDQRYRNIADDTVNNVARSAIFSHLSNAPLVQSQLSANSVPQPAGLAGTPCDTPYAFSGSRARILQAPALDKAEQHKAFGARIA